MEGLYRDTAKVFMRILLIFVVMTIAVEVFFYIFVYKTGQYNYAKFKEELIRYCIIPSALSVIAYIVNYFVLDSPNISLESKKYSCLITFELICIVTAYSHSTYYVTWGIMLLPISLSTIYGEKKFLRLATEISLLGLCFIVLKASFISVDKPITLIMQSAIAAMMLVLAYVASMIILRYIQYNSKIIMDQKNLQGNLEKQVSIDAMTGLYNHTAFYDELGRMIKESDRTNTKLCISVVDIDNFKSVNDTYGHSKGDEVLIVLSNILKTKCREYIVCRYGGEEFAVIFYGLGLKDATLKMESVLEEFRNYEFEWCNHPITFSCGVCKHFDIRISAEELFRQADKYLYKAKKNGKNQVVSE